MMLYRFDKKLRLLIFNEIEKIEVAVRSAIVTIGCEMTGNPFWITDSTNFNDQNKFLRTCIAKKYGLQMLPFESWLTIISLTRNYCCHHARVWNKQNTIRPMLPNHTDYAWLTLPTDPLRIYFDISIIKYFLNIISPQNDMRDKLMKLLSVFPNIDTAAMGFPVGWQQEPLWL